MDEEDVEEVEEIAARVVAVAVAEEPARVRDAVVVAAACLEAV